MNINFSEITNKFNLYLKDLYKEKETDLSNISIFDYCNEFKDYISEEYDLDSEDIIYSDLDNIMNTDFLNNQTDKTENPSNDENTGFIVGLIDNLLKSDSFKKEIDINEDGTVDQDELNNLFKFISKNDENAENISIYDITKGINDIKQGEYKKYNNENSNIDLGDIDIPENNQNIESGNNISNGMINSNPVSSGSNSSTGEISSIKDSSSGNNSSGGTVSLAFMDEEQLNKELEKRESKVEEKQNALDAIYNGTDNTIAYWQGIVDNAYETYLQQLENYKINEELKQQVTKTIEDINKKEGEIDKQDQLISQQETTVSNAQTDYDNAVSTRESLEASLSALEGKKGATEEEQAAIDSQIQALRGEVEAAKAAEEAALNALNNAENQLVNLENQKTSLQNDLDILNKNKASIESQIIDVEPQMQNAINNYNTQKAAFNEQKTISINNAKSEINEAQNEVNEIKTVINDNKNRNSRIEYSDNFLGKDIIQYALQFLGYNEADTSADIFLEKWHSSSSQTGWCAAFVSYVYEHMKSADQIPQWYQDIENQYWQVNVHSAAKEAGAIIDSSEAKMGDIVLYDYNGDGTMQHIGIVVAMEGNKMITIEGNSGNQVRIVEHNLDNPANCNMAFCKVT